MFYPLATQFLRDDHKSARGLFQQVVRIQMEGETEALNTVVDEFLDALEVHSTLEKDIFYPKLKESAESESSPECLAALEDSVQDHKDLDYEIQTLRALNPGSENFLEKISGFMTEVEEHITQEESVLFPLAERVMGPFLGEVGKLLQQRKDELKHGFDHQYAA